MPHLTPSFALVEYSRCKDGKNDGKPKNPFCEPSKYDCLTHEPFRLLRQIFSLLARIVSKLFLCVRNPICSPVGTNTLAGGLSYFCDPDWTNYSGRFYRLRSP